MRTNPPGWNLFFRAVLTAAALAAAALVWLAFAPLGHAAQTLYLPGNTWPDVDALERGEELRVWMTFLIPPEGTEADPEQSIDGAMPMEQVETGLRNLYQAQLAVLNPGATLPDNLTVYLVDSAFERSIDLTGYAGTLSQIAMIGSETTPSMLFQNIQNPLGLLRSGMEAYVRQQAAVSGIDIDHETIAALAKEAMDKQHSLDEAQTGFILLLAPKGQTRAPMNAQLRHAIPTDTALLSAKKPSGHVKSKLMPFAEGGNQITQLRIKSGEYLDIRLYNGVTQLSFRQQIGFIEGKGYCIDLILYQRPRNLKNFWMGYTGLAVEQLLDMGLTNLHIVLATPSGSSPYQEYWIEIPLESLRIPDLPIPPTRLVLPAATDENPGVLVVEETPLPQDLTGGIVDEVVGETDEADEADDVDGESAGENDADATPAPEPPVQTPVPAATLEPVG